MKDVPFESIFSFCLSEDIIILNPLTFDKAFRILKLVVNDRNEKLLRAMKRDSHYS